MSQQSALTFFSHVLSLTAQKGEPMRALLSLTDLSINQFYMYLNEAKKDEPTLWGNKGSANKPNQLGQAAYKSLMYLADHNRNLDLADICKMLHKSDTLNKVNKQLNELLTRFHTDYVLNETSDKDEVINILTSNIEAIIHSKMAQERNTMQSKNIDASLLKEIFTIDDSNLDTSMLLSNNRNQKPNNNDSNKNNRNINHNSNDNNNNNNNNNNLIEMDSINPNADNTVVTSRNIDTQSDDDTDMIVNVAKPSVKPVSEKKLDSAESQVRDQQRLYESITIPSDGPRIDEMRDASIAELEVYRIGEIFYHYIRINADMCYFAGPMPCIPEKWENINNNTKKQLSDAYYTCLGSNIMLKLVEILKSIKIPDLSNHNLQVHENWVGSLWWMNELIKHENNITPQALEDIFEDISTNVNLLKDIVTCHPWWTRQLDDNGGPLFGHLDQGQLDGACQSFMIKLCEIVCKQREENCIEWIDKLNTSQLEFLLPRTHISAITNQPILKKWQQFWDTYVCVIYSINTFVCVFLQCVLFCSNHCFID